MKLQLLILAALVAQPAYALKLNPQKVVDLALSQGYSVKQAELNAQLSYLQLAQAKAAFDLNFTITPGYTYTEAQQLTGQGNVSDKTFVLNAGLSKLFSTGTQLQLQYGETRQSSVLSSFSAANRAPDANMNTLFLTVRQALWSNAFGYASRLAVEAGENAVDSALENREEAVESSLLNAMTLFWNAYINEQALKENMSARDKYEQLIKNVRRKAGYSLSTPGELPQLEAEFQATQARVKSSSAAYLNSVTTLLTALRVETNEQIELEAPAELPPVPVLAPKSVEDLRAVRVAKTNLDTAEKSYSSVKNRNQPTLSLVLQAGTTGVDQENSAALAEMSATTHPTYFVGLEFATPIGSDIFRANVANADVQKQINDTMWRAQLDQSRDLLTRADRSVTAQYSVAKLAEEAVQQRIKAVNELERSYRQGRQPLIELIRAYNDLFNAQLSRAQAVGQYHILLNELAAARDELVNNVRR